MPDDLSAIETALAEYAYSINTVWVLVTAALVFFMQAGFALVEAGFTRSKNTTNILFKNLMDFTIGTIAFWAIGFGIMFGSSNGFWGGIDLFDHHLYRYAGFCIPYFPDSICCYCSYYCVGCHGRTH